MKILSKLQREPGKERRLGRVKPLPYVLIFPAMALFTLFTFYPFIKTIVLSFALTISRVTLPSGLVRTTGSEC